MAEAYGMLIEQAKRPVRIAALQRLVCCADQPRLLRQSEDEPAFAVLGAHLDGTTRIRPPANAADAAALFDALCLLANSYDDVAEGRVPASAEERAFAPHAAKALGTAASAALRAASR